MLNDELHGIILPQSCRNTPVNVVRKYVTACQRTGGMGFRRAVDSDIYENKNWIILSSDREVEIKGGKKGISDVKPLEQFGNQAEYISWCTTYKMFAIKVWTVVWIFLKEHSHNLFVHIWCAIIHRKTSVFVSGCLFSVATLKQNCMDAAAQ